MLTSRNLWAGLLVCVLVLAGTVLVVADNGRRDPAAGAPAGQPMSREEMMAAMEKFAMPVEQHKQLAQFVGEFKADAHCTMPGMEPTNMPGTLKNEMILGGRWLKGDFAGNMMGRDFKGFQLLGYDTAAKKYVGAWVDDMSTMMTYMEGTADASGKVITLTSENVNPMTGQTARMRHVLTLTDKDNHKADMYMTGPDGKEAKMMEITYTRTR